MARARSLVLVGMMASGKTTTGEAVARRLGWDFLDSDRQVEQRAGRTVEEIWKADGEAGFRDLEAQALAEAVASTDERPAVIAAAGGVVLDPRNRELLKANPPVVWLRARPETLAGRAGTGAGRPLLEGDPAGALLRLEAERRPFYEEVAGVVVDVDDLRPDQVVDSVIDAVDGR
ncbi:MAG: shikimate kinase [Acidimicrobiia bacterium]